MYSNVKEMKNKYIIIILIKDIIKHKAMNGKFLRKWLRSQKNIYGNIYAWTELERTCKR